jgi:excisionase family DNA binding protein
MARQEATSRKDPLGITVDEACELLRCSRPHVYSLVKKRILRGFHLGDLFRIDYAHLMRHIETGTAAMPPSHNPYGKLGKPKVTEPAE